MAVSASDVKRQLNETLSINAVKNLSVVINGYRQLGFEFEYFDELKKSVKKTITDLAYNSKHRPDVEVLKTILYEFPELEFDDEDRKEVFNSLLMGFKIISSKTDTNPLYFSIFGELVKTIDYFSPTNAKLKELCTAIRKRKAGEGNYSIVAVLNTVLEGFGSLEEDLKSQLLTESKITDDSKQKD